MYFKQVGRCSLVLAGTSAVFPALSEVFSPIPRQFHRVDIKPFARWSETLELVRNPIPKDLVDALSPKRDDVRELHQLTGGSPDEIRIVLPPYVPSRRRRFISADELVATGIS